MKIVVAGPPHSGKSVFLGGLCENLPRSSRYLFRACPDGEGSWTWRGNGAEKHRRKGSFSQEIVDWYCQSLASCSLAPIVLVDIGGRTSSENARIVSEGGITHGIILAGDRNAVPEWEAFLAQLGVEVVAVLDSDYQGAADSIQQTVPRLEGVVHHLERGEVSVNDRPAIVAVAELILSLAGPELGRNERKEGRMLLNGNVISIPALAAALGKNAVERTLPNGKVVQQLCWEGVDLASVAGLLHNQSATFPEVVDIDGAAPAWLVAALVHEVHPRSARVNSPDGYIAVGCPSPSGDGSGCGWTVSDLPALGERRCVRVEFALDPSVPLAPAALDMIVPPEVGLGTVVVLSGRGPNWLMASLAMAYHGRAAACATFQPGAGATIAWTHVQDIALGLVIAVQ
ncbi:MAG: CRISPR-associated protein Csx3 [Patescibacteria group bacterium]|jgi:CRISPR-associated Csx3 family protein|nr:CRISPR-associated protein Csx3 [Patescibacteria group bacterium]